MTLANGLVISKICYLIQFWGGCEDYLFHSLQVKMNRAARSVTGLYFYKETFGEVWLAYSEAAGVLSNHTVGAQDSTIQEATVLAQ